MLCWVKSALAPREVKVKTAPIRNKEWLNKMIFIKQFRTFLKDEKLVL